MSKGPRAPQKSAEEIELDRQQVQLLTRQNEIQEEVLRQQELLQPLLFQEAGIKTIFDEEGQISGFEFEDDLGIRGLRKDVEKRQLERTQAALAGELPINPALERELQTQEEVLNNQLIKDFGSLSAARNSTPGQERIDRFNRFKAETLENARRGDLTVGEQIGIARSGANINARNANIALPSNLLTGRLTPGLSGNINQTLQGLRNERFGQAQLEQQQGSPIGTIIGVGAGFALGGPAGGAVGGTIGSGIGQVVGV